MTWSPGDEVTAVEKPVADVVRAFVPDSTATVTTRARFSGTRRQPWGTALVISINVTALSEANTPPEGGSPLAAEALVETGELLMRDIDGTAVSIHLRQLAVDPGSRTAGGPPPNTLTRESEEQADHGHPVDRDARLRIPGRLDLFWYDKCPFNVLASAREH